MALALLLGLVTAPQAAAPFAHSGPLSALRAGSTTVEALVSASADDAGLDYATCEYTTTHPVIYFGKCQDGMFLTSGLRFAGVSVPRNATILSAFIRFEVDRFTSDDLHLALHVEDSANAQPFNLDPAGDQAARTVRV